LEGNVDYYNLFRGFYLLKKRWNQKKYIGILLCGSAENEVDLVCEELYQFLKHNNTNVKDLKVTTALPSRTCLIEGAWKSEPWAEPESFSLLKIGQSRKWFPSYRGSTFQWLPIWFVFRLSDFISDDRKEKIYSEFHGTLGEAKDSLLTIAAVTFFMDVDPSLCHPDFSLSHLLNFLKIFPCNVSDICPYYAGPVTIKINIFFPTAKMQKLWNKTKAGFHIPERGYPASTICKDLRRAANVAHIFSWLTTQPNIRPHIHSNNSFTLLCTLLKEPLSLSEMVTIMRPLKKELKNK
jgi:hypothetical protein